MEGKIDIQAGMNFLDAALASAGSMEDLFSLALLNGKSITDDLVPGITLVSTGLKYSPSVLGAVANPDIDQVQVISSQTLLDLAIQQLGSMEAIFDLAKLNGLSISDQLTDGQNLAFNINPVNRIIAKRYKDNGWKPASATTIPGAAPIEGLEGIDYWAIEIDFIVN